MAKWVDFRLIKQKITIPMVLEHYGILNQFKQSSKGYRGPCPVHGGKPEHSNQFHFDDHKWKCFGGCDMNQIDGNVLGLVAAKENISLREAALKIADWFNLSTDHPSTKQENPEEPESSQAVVDSQNVTAQEKVETPPNNSTEQEQDPENPELTFRLKTLSTDHPFFPERGITPQAVQHFQAGFCSRGMFKGRIVFPLYRPTDGKLVGYTGRTVEPITDTNPKWLLGAKVKPKLLFNLHQVASQFDQVIVVEGCLDAAALFQAGFTNVVALLGKEVLTDNRLSYDQVRLLGQFDQVILLLDGDQDGRNGASKSAGILAQKTWVRIITPPEDKDPSDLSPEQLQNLLSFIS